MALVLLSVTSAVALTWWKGASSRFRSTPAVALAWSAQTSPKLTKEYIYAGGRLVAVEEVAAAAPAPAPPPAPTGLLATATASSEGAPSVTMTWAPAAGSVDHYEVERKISLTDPSPYTFLCREAPCADATALTSKVYIYRVRAVDASGGTSSYSNHDLATTFPFTDDPLNQNGVGTQIRARHFMELREAVNAIRGAVALPPFDWSSTPPQSSGTIYASHLNDLRASLSEALGGLGLSGPQFAPAVKGDRVTHQPVQQLRYLTR